jgi:signal transduction histidine kinase
MSESHIDDLRSQLFARSRERGELSYDMRAPLPVAGAHSRLLDVDVTGPLPGAQPHEVRPIQANERHVLEEFNSVISFVRWDGEDSLTLEDISVREAVELTDTEVTRAASARGVVYAPRDTAIAVGLAVRAEPAALRTILLDLLDHAVKFSRSGDSMAIRAMAVGEVVWIRATATAAGITDGGSRPTSELPMHEDYIRTQDRDGRGLADLQILASTMGGEVSVFSKGLGSTFTLALPRGRQPAALHPAAR